MNTDIFESVVISWLQDKGYFIMSSVRYGNQEMDILAMKPETKCIIHAEVTCSSEPMGNLGSDGENIDKKSLTDCANYYIEKKYKNTEDKIKDLTCKDIEIKPMLVYGQLRNEEQLKIFKKAGIECKSVNEIIKDIGSKKLKEFLGDKRLKQFIDILGK